MSRPRQRRVALLATAALATAALGAAGAAGAPTVPGAETGTIYSVAGTGLFVKDGVRRGGAAG